MIAGGAGPSGIDLDGVGDDRDHRDALAFFIEEPVDHVGVERVGVDDEVGLEVIKEGCQSVLGLGDEGEGFGEILSIGRAIDPGPDAGGVGRDLAIAATENPVDDWIS